MRHITISILNAVLVVLIIFYYTWLSFADVSKFIQFESITFSGVYDEGLLFTSRFETKKEGHYIFSDRLLCNNVQISSFVVDIPAKYSHPMEDVQWLYQAKVGSGECQLEATTCVELAFGVTRCTLTKSDLFTIDDI